MRPQTHVTFKKGEPTKSNGPDTRTGRGCERTHGSGGDDSNSKILSTQGMKNGLDLFGLR